MPAAAAKIARPIGLNETASRTMGLKRTKKREIHGRFAAVNLDADATGQITRKLLINTNQRIGRNFGREKYFWGASAPRTPGAEKAIPTASPSSIVRRRESESLRPLITSLAVVIFSLCPAPISASPAAKKHSIGFFVKARFA